MKIVFLPEFLKSAPAAAPAPDPDRAAGPAYVVEVPTAAPAPADRLSDTEWSAFMGLS